MENKIIDNEKEVYEVAVSNEIKQKVTREKYFISSKDIFKYTIGGISMALLYLFCFAENSLVVENHRYDVIDDISLDYNISVTLFIMLTSIILVLVLHFTNNIVKKRALLWLIPINIIGLYYTMFMSGLRLLNGLALFILFAIFTLDVTSSNKLEFPKTPFILRQIIGNYYMFTRFFIKDERDTESSRSINKDTVNKVIKGIVLAVPLVFIITVLLISSDVIFLEYILEKLESINKNNKVDFYIIAFIVYIYCTGFIPNGKRMNNISVNYKEKVYDADTIISSVFLAMINLVFLLFTYVQFKTFTEKVMQKMTEDNMYYYYLSNSAREGFFGLLLVTGINFAVMYVFINKFMAQKIKAIRIQLYILCFFTTVIMGCSAYKMYSYINELGFTMLRLAVITFLVMECFLIILTVYKLWKQNNHNYVRNFMFISLVFYILVNITSSYYVQTSLNIAMLKADKINEVYIKKAGRLESAGLINELIKDKKYYYSDNTVNIREDWQEGTKNHDPYEYRNSYNEKGIWKTWFFKY